jgi:RHS repeat-associated protein
MPYNEAPAGSAGPSFNQSFGDVFDSHEYDSATRELHPVQGRWIQPDFAGLSAVDPSNPQTWNRYAYVNNNPLSFVDPSGLLMDPVCATDGGGCGGGGNNDDTTYVVDGIEMSPEQAGILLGTGMGAECPSDSGCTWVNGHGEFSHYVAFANGGGSYAYLGPGALYFSAQQAGIAAVRNINGKSIDQNREYAGEIFEADPQNGTYSYTVPVPGDVASSTVDPTAIPLGSIFVGDYHTHGADSEGMYDDEHFSPQDRSSTLTLFLMYPNFIGGFLGTPGGRVEFYSPYPAGTVTVLHGPGLP